MNRPRHHDIVEVCPHEVQDQLAEIVRRHDGAQTAIVRRVLTSPALREMVNAVTCRDIDGVRVTITIRG